MDYAIEVSNLVKRYPTSKKDDASVASARGQRGNVGGMKTILGALRGNKGPFIEALKGIDLKVKRGEILGILGPNGAGKSTLIKILCTLVIHDEGEVYVNGFDPKTEPGKVLRNLQAVLPESRGFNWRLSGRQNLEFYAQLYGLSDNQAKERINYLLDFTNLKDRADDGYQRYSTGMQRKLLLCRALLRNTPIIVFDEPTTGLDPKSAEEFRKMIIERLVKEEGKTILLSTHNLQEAQELCNRIAILNRGKVLVIDTPDNVRNLAIDDRYLKVVLASCSSVDCARLVKVIQATAGVQSVIPEIDQDQRLCGLTLRVKKDLDLSGILSLISKSGLHIKAVNTKESTLEEAFSVIINQGMSSNRTQEEKSS